MLHLQAMHALEAFFEALSRVKSMILENKDQIVCTIPDWPEFTESRASGYQRLIHAIEDNEILPGEDARRTRFYPGLIEADKATIDAFCNLNDCKHQFEKAMHELKTENPKEHRLVSQFIRAGECETRFERYGRRMGPISINHINRKLSILPVRPRSISYSWTTKSISIVTVTKNEAIRALESLNEQIPDHIEIQIQQLASVPDCEPLARVIPQTAGAKINIMFKGKKTPTTIKSALPVIVPLGPEKVRTKFLSSDDVKKKGGRLVREDQAIESDPIAPSIHVHRYQVSRRAV